MNLETFNADQAERYMIETSMDLDVEALLGEHVYPIRIRLEMEKKYPMLTKQEIVNTIDEYQYMMLAYRHCQMVGHDMKVEEYGNPESGGASWHCRRCRTGGQHTLY